MDGVVSAGFMVVFFLILLSCSTTRFNLGTGICICSLSAQLLEKQEAV
jgi:hypothetical protein